MKKITFTIAMIAVCTSMSFATWDYTLSSGYEPFLFLENEESLLVTGGGQAG